MLFIHASSRDARINVIARKYDDRSVVAFLNNTRNAASLERNNKLLRGFHSICIFLLFHVKISDRVPPISHSLSSSY